MLSNFLTSGEQMRLYRALADIQFLGNLVV